MSRPETAGASRLAALRESACEANESYDDFLEELWKYLALDAKKFRRSVNRVAPLLSEAEHAALQHLSHSAPTSRGDFEDRFEEICVEKTVGQRRELMRLWLRHL